MIIKSKLLNAFALIVICAIGVSCKKEGYAFDGCEFTQNSANKYSFTCTRDIDATATFSDDDIISMAREKVEKTGAKLALSQNQNWIYISKINAKLNPASEYPKSYINIKGNILIGDIKLSQKFENAKNIQTISNMPK